METVSLKGLILNTFTVSLAIFTQGCPNNCMLPPMGSNDTSPSVGSNDTCDAANYTCLHGCTVGFAGKDCSIRCPENCGEPKEQYNAETCDTTTNNCLHGCKLGYAGSNCSAKCPAGCLKPPEGNDSAVCDDVTSECAFGCNDGFFGQKCLEKCSDKILKCETCRTVNVTRNIECTRCVYNFYLNNSGCQACPSLCVEAPDRQSPACNPENGDCPYGCNEGKYGRRCDLFCASNCKDGICEQLSGRCRFGCIDNQFSGQNCDQDCPTFCQNGTCRQHDGLCLEGCSPGWFGDKCDKRCSEGCGYIICDRTNASCVCKTGYHGPACRKQCSETCLNQTCEQLCGKCTLGCVLGYSGVMSEVALPLFSIVALGLVVGEGLFCLFLLIALLCLFRKYRKVIVRSQVRNNNHCNSYEIGNFSTDSDEDVFYDTLAYNSRPGEDKSSQETESPVICYHRTEKSALAVTVEKKATCHKLSQINFLF